MADSPAPADQGSHVRTDARGYSHLSHDAHAWDTHASGLRHRRWAFVHARGSRPGVHATGFDITRHVASLLSDGGLGWIQITSFVLTGLFRADPAYSFPPGPPAGPEVKRYM